MKNYVITISREFGSGGKYIGTLLSKKLNIPCYESQILDMASDYSGLNRGLFEQQDESMSYNKILRGLRDKPNKTMIVEPSDKDFVSNNNLFNIQSFIIKDLANHTSCIIVGKCANEVLAGFDNVVNVFVMASKDKCIESIQNRMGVSPQEAEKMIYRTNKYRSDYFKYYSCGKKWEDPKEYDMVLNSGVIGREKCADLLEGYVKIKFPEAFENESN